MKVIYYCRNPRESWKHEYGVEYRILDELLAVDNVILTPHTAPYTKENFICMNDIAAQNVIDYFNNCLNKGYQVI